MLKLSLILVGGLLSGCSVLSLAPIADNNARDYHQVVENVTNDILVTNILRAKDHAPLHYSDLSTFTGSLTGVAAAQATFPFGPLRGSTTRDSVQIGGVSLQTAPSFTLGTLDTDDFTSGILTPVAGDVIGTFLQQGFVSPQEAFLLFFESVQGYGVTLPIHRTFDPSSPLLQFPTQATVHNDPDPDNEREQAGDTQPTNETEFGAFLAIANYDAPGLYVHGYHELRPIGDAFNLDLSTTYKDMAAVDFTKVRLLKTPNSKYALYSVSPNLKYVLCSKHLGLSAGDIQRENLTPDGYRIFALSYTQLPADSPSKVCTDDDVVVDSASPRAPIVLATRSAQGIIQYLGAILRFQEKHKDRGPVTLRKASSSGALFNLTQNSAGARFGVAYRDTTYYVSPASDKDHTLEVLAMVNQLLDEYKSAKDIPSIHPVTIVP